MDALVAECDADDGEDDRHDRSVVLLHPGCVGLTAPVPMMYITFRPGACGPLPDNVAQSRWLMSSRWLYS